MCGIFAYNGDKSAVEFLVNGLKKLEYRGYDSAGILCIDAAGNTYKEKSIGKVSQLEAVVDYKQKDKYTSGIAHTRWATHGKVTLENTHPHHSQTHRFHIVHNGIIENYQALKKLLPEDVTYYSQTDSEVIAKLFENYFQKDLLTTAQIVCEKLEGAYSIAVIDTLNPSEILGAKFGSPLLVGISPDAHFLSSDSYALGNVADSFIPLDDSDFVLLSKGDYKIYQAGKLTTRALIPLVQKDTENTTGDFSTYTEKEIHEIPQVFHNALDKRIDVKTGKITNATLEELSDLNIKNIEIIASGSSYFAGMAGKNWFEEISNIKSQVHVSSEFLSQKIIDTTNTLYVILSQSGETADLRECVKKIQTHNGQCFGIVNVEGSTIARMCDMGLYTHSGNEIGVASTKNIVAQLCVLLLMGIALDRYKKNSQEIIKELPNIQSLLGEQLKNTQHYTNLARKYSQYNDFFYLGRNIAYATACECSLKIKELSYVHAESYPTGELKHGPLALVGPDFPCIVINPLGLNNQKSLSNVQEIKARDGVVLGVISQGDTQTDLYDDIITIPDSHPLLSAFFPLIPLWIFSVGVARELGKDIDKPQNLAKSVTVE